ncbi:MAG: NusG domain II-containing protein [Pseudomonadota bacterium]
MTRADAALLTALVLTAGILFVLLPRYVISGGSTVEVSSDNVLYGRYSLNKNRVVNVPGPLGETVLDIRDGTAFIRSSPCKNKQCVHMGRLDHKGGLLVCVPNRVVVRVGGESSDELDAVSR